MELAGTSVWVISILILYIKQMYIKVTVQTNIALTQSRTARFIRMLNAEVEKLRQIN